MNISLMVPVRKNLGVGKWKKIGVLAIQKVAKTGNIGKNSGRRYPLCIIPRMQNVNLN